MSFELPDGVGGLHSYQPLPDINGKNGIDGNATTSGVSKIPFSELLSRQIEKASRPTANANGANPKQMSGVGTGGTIPNVRQSNIIHTGNPLDLVIEGAGYFILSDGQQNIYTRSGALAVDVSSNLVDPVTGYALQRIGSAGEGDGFQVPGDSNIRIPYRAVIPAKGTSTIKVSGNLSKDAVIASGPQTQVIASNIAYTTDGGTFATTHTEISLLDQFGGGSGMDGRLEAGESGTIGIYGYNPDGSALSEGLSFSVNPSTTLGDFIDHLNTNVLSGATASLVDGRIEIKDDAGGYSRTDVALSYSGTGSLATPGYFEVLTAGGQEVKKAGITIYDSEGNRHVLAGAFVRTNKPNTWDMVLSSVSGDVTEITLANRRIENICFNASDGSYAGLESSNLPRFAVTFAHDTLRPQTIEIQMGTAGRLDGLTQFKGSSTAAEEQDGYEAGRLSTVSFSNDGMIVGVFSNGVRRNIASVGVALFRYPKELERIGGGYFAASGKSGNATAVRALKGGAGAIQSGALEKSNEVVAAELCNMIQNQNGFRANERAIKVANEILQEMSNLFR